MARLKVAVRVRPLSQSEVDNGSKAIAHVENEDTITITNIKVPEQNAGDSRERTRRFTFDYCFHENSAQSHVFEAVESVIGKAIKNRCHSCVLAYGQSSTGKTHTMMGTMDDPGLTPMLCQRIFEYLQEAAVEEEISDMKVSVSYLEIYNEKVRDLLATEDYNGKWGSLKVREHPQNGPYVQGLTEHSVADSENLIRWLEVGNGKRRVAATATNPTSSRSHSVFTVSCAGAKLQLVDLAGSERTGRRSYCASRFREGANINKSLVALGNVISALAEQTFKWSKNTRRRFVPYRDSVLTWLLKDTLGGNSNTVMIATVSPSSACYSETVNTLRFGQRAKLIVSRPVVIEDPKEGIIRKLRAEIARLRELLKLGEISDKPMDLVDGNLVDDKLSEGIKSPPTTPVKSSTEQLVPLMSVSSNVEEKRVKQLRRTYSVGGLVDKDMNGSQEDLSPSTKHSKVLSPSNSSSSSSRRSSLNKPLKPILQKKLLETGKLEKSVGTEVRMAKVEAKVDSIRRLPVKPRSQIIASVTNRLYSKIKKKEVATDTDDIHLYKTEDPVPKELKICSNARFKLRELTQRAMKAHKNRHVETQTEVNPVLRVKEIGTDVQDLKVALMELCDFGTNPEMVQTKETGVNCNFNQVTPTIHVTRTCGTQSGDSCVSELKTEKEPTISLTQYLQDQFQISSLHPIYTSAININISHNYINDNQNGSSEDSLELPDNPNVCFPTPDLISNHNSLEQHTHAPVSSISLPEERLESISSLPETQLPTCVANFQITPKYTEKLQYISMAMVCAPEVCIIQNKQEICGEFPKLNLPELARANIVEPSQAILADDLIKIKEPQILKSIIKLHPSNQFLETASPNHSSFEQLQDLPDSIEYHLANKQVRFSKKKSTQNQRMVKAMSSFLEEATILMSNLTMAANKFDSKFVDKYELEVTVNDLPNLSKESSGSHCCKHKNSSPTEFGSNTPINRYESVLQEACKRLEEKIDKIPRTRSCFLDDSSSLDEQYGPSSYNPWDLSETKEVEDSSIESNPLTYSDYGSLPRRRYKRHRTPTCSPSAFLKQLTTMRKQIIDSSREEFLRSSLN